jgi:hypothetical protein
MPFIYDDNVIQTLSPYGPDNSLNIRILPRRARGRKHFVDAETFHSIAKSTAIDAVSVTQPVAWSGIEGKGLHQLLSTGQLDVRSNAHLKNAGLEL